MTQDLLSGDKTLCHSFTSRIVPPFRGAGGQGWEENYILYGGRGAGLGGELHPLGGQGGRVGRRTTSFMAAGGQGWEENYILFGGRGAGLGGELHPLGGRWPNTTRKNKKGCLFRQPHKLI